MKVSLIALLLSLSSLAFAEVIPARINNIAKSIRHSYWARSYDSVRSTQELFSTASFAQFLREENDGVEVPLETADIAKIRTCLRATKCDVYRVTITADYQAGSGAVFHWVLLNSGAGRHQEIIQTVYEE